MSKAHPQKIAKLGLQIKTSLQCKICQSEHRGEIEDIATLRLRGETLPDGTRPTQIWMAENAPELWGIPLNHTNLNRHMKVHFRAGGTSADVATVDARTELNRKARDGEIIAVAPEEFLENIVAVAHQRVLVDPGSVTIDQGMKAVAELTKRKHDEQTATLMQGLVGAVEKVAMRPGPEAEVLDVVDAEVVDEPDTESGSPLGGEQGAGRDAALVPALEAPQDVSRDQDA